MDDGEETVKTHSTSCYFCEVLFPFLETESLRSDELHRNDEDIDLRCAEVNTLESSEC